MSRDGGRGPHSHLGDLHHGQAVLKDSIWEGVQVTRETFFERNLLS